MRQPTTLELVLTGTGGELDRQTITFEEARDDMDEAVNLAVHDVIEAWRLSPGDTITIKTMLGSEPPVCQHFLSDGRGCCRNCGHFHGPDERTAIEDADDHLQNLADRDRES